MDWVNNIISAIKLPKKFIATIFLVTTALLFLPNSIVSKMHLSKFIDKFGLYFGIISIFTGILLLIEIVIYFYSILKGNKAKADTEKLIISNLNDLDPIEKAVLREFYIQNQNTIRLPFDNPVIAGLKSKGILQPIGDFGEKSLAGMLYSSKISENTKKHLNTETHIGIPHHKPSQSEIEFIKNSRPDFILKIKREESRYDMY